MGLLSHSLFSRLILRRLACRNGADIGDGYGKWWAVPTLQHLKYRDLRIQYFGKIILYVRVVIKLN